MMAESVKAESGRLVLKNREAFGFIPNNTRKKMMPDSRIVDVFSLRERQRATYCLGIVPSAVEYLS